MAHSSPTLPKIHRLPLVSHHSSYNQTNPSTTRRLPSSRLPNPSTPPETRLKSFNASLTPLTTRQHIHQPEGSRAVTKIWPIRSSMHRQHAWWDGPHAAFARARRRLESGRAIIVTLAHKPGVRMQRCGISMMQGARYDVPTPPCADGFCTRYSATPRSARSPPATRRLVMKLAARALGQPAVGDVGSIAMWHVMSKISWAKPSG